MLLMHEANFWISFVIVVLATWRVTYFLTNEDGPEDVVARLRVFLGDSAAGRLMDCFGCLSLIVAMPMALLIWRKPLELVLGWLAIAGGAFLLERTSPVPVIIERMPESSEIFAAGETFATGGGAGHDLQRSNTNDSGWYGDANYASCANDP